ncbi:MAG: YraN family protein [Deltaproteobacteria bacterium]|nr:YraN family protein [Deltaproteobacteria bacterium]
MTWTRLSTGAIGEEEAQRVLKKNGYKILDRNFRARFGEIDIVAMDRGVIVFVEVRTKKAQSMFASPGESIDMRKQKRITLAAEEYLTSCGMADHPARFDVVSIEIDGGAFKAELIKDAFDAGL